MAKATKTTTVTEKKPPVKKATKKPIDSDVMELEAEEILHEETPSNSVSSGKELMTAEQIANKEVARFDVARDWIANKKAEADKVKISGVDDKENYKAAERLLKEIREKRFQVRDRHKEIKSDYLLITRRVDSENKELTELLLQPETDLKKKIEEIDNIKEQEKLRIETEAQEKLQKRVSDLISNGVKFDGSFYSIGENISMDVVSLKAMNDEIFNSLFARVVEVNQSIIDAEKKRLQDEADEKKKVEDQKAENEKKEKELKEEREQMLKERTESRIEFLKGIGCVMDDNEYMCYIKGNVVSTIPNEIISKTDTNQWSSFVLDFKTNVMDKMDQEYVEATKKAEEAETKRLADLKAETDLKHKVELRESELKNLFGCVPNGEGGYSTPRKYEDIPIISIQKSIVSDSNDADWLKVIEMFHVEHKDILEQLVKRENELKAKDESDRVAALADVDKVYEWLQKMASIFEEIPKVETDIIADPLTVFELYMSAGMNILIEALPEKE